MDKVQILDPLTGDFQDTYGEAGTAPGQLKLPLDIAIDSAGAVIAANALKGKIETIYSVP
jgi:hypothetical protein